MIKTGLRDVEFGHGRWQVAGGHHVDATFDAQFCDVRMKRVRQQTTHRTPEARFNKISYDLS